MSHRPCELLEIQFPRQASMLYIKALKNTLKNTIKALKNTLKVQCMARPAPSLKDAIVPLECLANTPPCAPRPPAPLHHFYRFLLTLYVTL